MMDTLNNLTGKQEAIFLIVNELVISEFILLFKSINRDIKNVAEILTIKIVIAIKHILII